MNFVKIAFWLVALSALWAFGAWVSYDAISTGVFEVPVRGGDNFTVRRDEEPGKFWLHLSVAFLVWIIVLPPFLIYGMWKRIRDRNWEI